MSHHLLKKIVYLASIPMMASAIALVYQKPVNAFSASAIASQVPIEVASLSALEQSSNRTEIHTFLLTNSQSEMVHYFYMSPSNVISWEEDLLDHHVLLPYSSFYVYIADGRESCFYDFRAIFSDGAETAHYGINICELSTYTL